MPDVRVCVCRSPAAGRAWGACCRAWSGFYVHCSLYVFIIGMFGICEFRSVVLTFLISSSVISTVLAQ